MLRAPSATPDQAGTLTNGSARLKPANTPETDSQGPECFALQVDLQQVNVFEWCWEHSTELPGIDRVALLYHAFHATDFPDRAERDAYQIAVADFPDPYTNGRLITAGYLAIDERAQALWFPAYQAWLNTQAVTR